MLNIFEYWNNRNKSKTYSQKLNKRIALAVKTISNHPSIGKLSAYSGVRFGVLNPYLIVYKEFDDVILIVTIWDGRQDPGKLEERIK
jgi:plasmid stabilization system protein ParE